MIIYVILVIIFLLMIAFPFVLSSFAPNSKEKETMVVASNNKKDPRYFAKSFRQLMEKALADIDNKENSEKGILILSKAEDFVFSEDLEEGYTNVKKLVVARESFCVNHKATFQKEIFAMDLAVMGENCKLRAVEAQKLELKDNCKVLRWADGVSMISTGNGCDLGKSATTEGNLNLGINCIFNKLYASRIVVGKISEKLSEEENKLEDSIEYSSIRNNIQRNIKTVDDKATFDATIITKHKLYVGENAIVKGHIKSNKKIVLKRGSVVYGNVFSEGDIEIEAGCRIYGDVFSQMSVFISNDSVIGQKDKVKSVVARQSLVLAEGVVIYGFAGCEYGGKTTYRVTFK